MSSSGVTRTAGVSSLEGEQGDVQLVDGAVADGKPVKWNNTTKRFEDATADLNGTYLAQTGAGGQVQGARVVEGPLSVLDPRVGAATAAADNTAAFATAVGLLPANGGRIYVPPGTWKGLWELAPGTVVEGASQNGTKLQLPAGSAGPLIGQTNPSNAEFTGLAKLYLDGTGGGAGARLIDITNAYSPSFWRDLQLFNAPGKGAVFTNCDSVVVDNFCTNDSGDIGLDMVGCTRMYLGYVEADLTVTGKPCMRLVQCDQAYLGLVHVEQKSAVGAAGSHGLVLDSCISARVGSVWAHGEGAGIQGAAVRITNDTVGGRSTNYQIGTVNTDGGFVNTVDDLVQGATFSEAGFPRMGAWHDSAILNNPTMFGLPLIYGDHFQFRNQSNIRNGGGVPGAGVGSDGDFYFRTDGGGAGTTHLYFKTGGAWVAVA